MPPAEVPAFAGHALPHASSGGAHAAPREGAGDQRLHLVVVGHVDHGKSTVVGRLLADTGSLPEGKLDQVRAHCAATARPFEYAFLLDALKDEQAQGITIDTARVFFSSARRRYLILDAPGHVEFLKSMITGAAHAEAALLVIDAQEGVQENSRRHGFMLSLLGVRQVAVVVNKMDLVGYQERAFAAITGAFGDFLARMGVVPSCFIPVSGRDGANVARRSAATPWYDGPTVLDALEAFAPRLPASGQPFRLPVQDVYKFTEAGDGRRIVAGTVLTGRLDVGDEIVFYPSGKRTRVKSIEAFPGPSPGPVSAGAATGLTLHDHLYIRRGEVAARAAEPAPQVTTRLGVSLFWLGREPMSRQGEYFLRLGTARVPARLERIERVIDASSLESRTSADTVQRHEVAECVLRLGRPLACDAARDVAETGRFVLVCEHEIRGGGIVRETLPDRESWVRDHVLLRNSKWEPSSISPEQRAERYNQTPTLVLITGEEHADRKSLARELEARLFAAGQIAYFLGIRNVLYGVDADLDRTADDRSEHMRRLAEVAHVMLDAGVILVVTAAALTPGDLEIVRTAVEPDRIVTVWLGDDVAAGLAPDLRLRDGRSPAEAAEEVRALLRDRGVLFRGV